MKLRLLGVIAGVLVLLVTSPAAVQAQDNPSASAQSTPVYSPQQLDQLLAPVALYPDQLLGQILMASTYPLEVVEAARWVQDPNNARLKGDQLAAALDQRDWDPSVKALVAFPRLLQMMSDRLDWMQQLGDAFLAQQADVMDSVQRLRQEAQAAGTLTSTPQQAVSAGSGGSIVIAPANPEVVYVPTYDPTVAYGAWPYPDYPPFSFPWPPGYVIGAGLFFGVGVAIVEPLWGWNDFDWRDHYVHIDVNRYNYIDRHYHERFQAPPVARDRWEHDPFHRHGVAYRDPGLRERYTKPVPGSPDVRRNFRGYDVTPRTGTTPAVGRPPAGVSQPTPGGVQPKLRRAPGAGVGGRPTPPRTVVTPPPPALLQPPAATLGRPAPGVKQPTPGAAQPQLRKAPAGAGKPTPRGKIVTPSTPSVPQAPTTTLGRPVPRAKQPTPAVAPSGPGKGRAGVVAQPARPGGTVTAPRAIQQPATIQRSAPPAFEGINRGPDVRAQGNRGRQSLQTIAPKGTGAAAPRATGGTPPSGNKRGGNDKLKRR